MVGAAGPGGRAVPAPSLSARCRRAGDAGRRGGAAGGRASPAGRGLRRPGLGRRRAEAGSGLRARARRTGRAVRAGVGPRGSVEPAAPPGTIPSDAGNSGWKPGPGWAGAAPSGLRPRSGAAPRMGARAPAAPGAPARPYTPQPRAARPRDTHTHTHFGGSVSDPVTRHWGLARLEGSRISRPPAVEM